MFSKYVLIATNTRSLQRETLHCMGGRSWFAKPSAAKTSLKLKHAEEELAYWKGDGPTLEKPDTITVCDDNGARRENIKRYEFTLEPDCFVGR